MWGECMKNIIGALFALFTICSISMAAEKDTAPVSMLHDGDRWVCLGDSITASNCYPPMLSRVFRHYHPEANLTVINSGQGGDTASDNPAKLIDRVLKYKPTIVSVMYGMNEAINSWQPGKDKKPIQDNYRKSLTYITKTLQAQGITVLLMSPTPTDPTSHSYFALDKTVPFINECAVIMQEVAKAEGAHYVPVQEKFIELQEKSPRGIVLTPDGVHPSSLGQYSIAHSLWQYAGFDKPLSKDNRSASPATPNTQIAVNLSSRFVKADATGVSLAITSTVPAVINASWSLVKRVPQNSVYEDTILRGQENINIIAGINNWTINIPNDKLPATPGQSADLMVDFRVGNSDTLYIIDLCRTQVLHLTDNRVSGEIYTEKERPEGKKLATWEVQKFDNSMLLNFEVFDKDIIPDGIWPFGRDGMNLMLDFRPTPRFADIGVDNEVTQTFLNVREKPFFSVGLRAWTGHGMDSAATAAGTRTETGYKVQMLINENFNLWTPVKMNDRDFVGLLVAVADHPNNSLSITPNQKNDTPVNLFANNLMIIDLKNKIAGDQIFNAHITSAQIQ
jgi:lysophospholipase L1-like esterase